MQFYASSNNFALLQTQANTFIRSYHGTLSDCRSYCKPQPWHDSANIKHWDEIKHSNENGIKIDDGIVLIVGLNLREGSTLGPGVAIMTNNGRGGKMLAVAINVTHQVIIYISLPRHFSFSGYSLCLWCCLLSCFFFVVYRLCTYNNGKYIVMEVKEGLPWMAFRI